MSSSIEALKQAVELEQQALDLYIIAMDNTIHEETKQTLKRYADDKQQKIDTLSWMVMAASSHPRTPTNAYFVEAGSSCSKTTVSPCLVAWKSRVRAGNKYFFHEWGPTT